MRQRTPEEVKEYMQKLRFYRIKHVVIARNTPCVFCSNKAQTLHHKDENQSHNRLNNLLPVCNACHLDIEHKKADNPEFFAQDIKTLFRRAGMPQEVVTPIKSPTPKPRVQQLFDPRWIYWHNPLTHFKIKTENSCPERLEAILKENEYKPHNSP